MSISNIYFFALIKVLRPQELCAKFVLGMERVALLKEQILIGSPSTRIEILTSKSHLILVVQLGSMKSD